MGLLPPVAQPVANIIGSGLNYMAQIQTNKTNLRINRETNQANRDLAEYAYSKDVEQWDRQNAYNSPEAQMSRFKAAGLNPHLVYGQGTAGNASGYANYNAPTMQSARVDPAQVDVPQVLGMYQDFKIKQGQADLIREQVETEKIKQTAEILRNTVDQKYLMSDRELENQMKSSSLSRSRYAEAMDAMDHQVRNTLGIDHEVQRSRSELEKTQLQVLQEKAENDLQDMRFKLMNEDLVKKQWESQVFRFLNPKQERWVRLITGAFSAIK